MEFSGWMALKKFTFLDQRVGNVEAECSFYEADSAAAERNAETDFSNIFSPYMDIAKKDYKYYTDEARTQSQPNILLKVIEYYVIADSWIKSQGGFTCPEAICEDIKQFIIK